MRLIPHQKVAPLYWRSDTHTHTPCGSQCHHSQTIQSHCLAMEQAVHLLLNYVATYPNDGTVYRASEMILCAHANAGFLNESQSCSHAGAHIFLSENDLYPRFSGAVLSIAQIIKFVMASAAESKLAALFITACKMIPHRQTLIDMGWPQPKSPIQTDNCTAAGVDNNNIVPRRSKMMDMNFLWLHCGASQDQFRYYWDAGSKNWADYNTQTPTMKPTDMLEEIAWTCSDTRIRPLLTIVLTGPNGRIGGLGVTAFY